MYGSGLTSHLILSGINFMLMAETAQVTYIPTINHTYHDFIFAKHHLG